MSLTASLTPSAVYYATGGGSWTSGYLFAGLSGSTNYRSRLELPIGDLKMGKSEKLVVAVTIEGANAYPQGCYAVLHDNNNFASGKVVSDTLYGGYTNGPHADLLANCLGESKSYLDKEGTTRVTGTMTNGQTCYFIFDTEKLQPNKTYYVYFMRNVDSTISNTTAWTHTILSYVSAELTYSEPNYKITLSDKGITTSYIIEAGTSIALPVLSEVGYNFLGWSESESATSGIMGPQTPTKDTTYYALWEAIVYSIEYYFFNNQTELSASERGANPLTYTVENTPFYVSAPITDKEIFVGWLNIEENTLERAPYITKNNLGDKKLQAYYKDKVKYIKINGKWELTNA